MADQSEARCQSSSPASNSSKPEFSKKQESSEERRRQLNRRAQKAFRERRTEHMAHLEVSIEQMKKDLQVSQQARSRAVEELMMVKYKNSLLERVLLEKGVDVHRELSSTQPRRKQHKRAEPHDHEPQPLKKCKRVFREPEMEPYSSHTDKAHKPVDIDACTSRPPSKPLEHISTSLHWQESHEHIPVQVYPIKRRESCHCSDTNDSSMNANLRLYPEPDTHASSIEATGRPYQLSSSMSVAIPSFDHLDPLRHLRNVNEQMLSTSNSLSPESQQSPIEFVSAGDQGEYDGGIEIGPKKFASIHNLAALVGDPFGLDDILNFPSQF